MSDKPSYEELEAKVLQLEQAVQKYTSRENALIQSHGDGFWVTDLSGRLLEVNPVYCRMSGYSMEELLSMEIRDLEGQMGPEELFSWIDEARLSGHVRFETRHIRRDGNGYAVEVFARCLALDDERLFISIRDISGRRKTEQSLIHLSETWELAQKMANIGYWRHRVADGTPDWSEQLFLVLGIDPGGGIPDFKSFLERVHPKDRVIFESAFENALQGRAYDIEVRIFFPDGTLHWINTQGIPHYDKSGELYEVFGIAQDITGHRMAEKALRESESLRRALFYSIPDPIWLKGPDGAYLACNPMFERFLGAREADIVGRTDYDFMPRQEADVFRNYDVMTMTGNLPRINEEYLTFKADGYSGEFETIKVPMKKADGELIGVLGVARDITTRKQTEASLKEASRKLEEAQKMARLGFWNWDVASDHVEWSREVYRIFGMDPKIKRPRIDTFFSLPFGSEDMDPGADWLERILNSSGPGSFERTFLLPDGTEGHYVLTYQCEYDDQRQLSAVKGTVQDITEKKRAGEEQKKMEEQLLQAQKMESVGRLAGGVAHDFNNMLSVIFGNAEMAMEEDDLGGTTRAFLTEIIGAAEHSANITRQLLAFARKQTISPKVLDLNDTVPKMLKMIRRLIREDIGMAFLPGENLWPVKMDPSQLDQILVNLCVNSMDAIGDTGKITVETDQVCFDEAYCRHHPGIVPGEFVRLRVNDDGCGMDSETRRNMFEPFFTTKGVNKGTGLGLSTVYGIVRQNDGFIHVYSEPGIGTSFRIYLRRYQDAGGPEMDAPAVASNIRGSETILLVEDDPSILKMTRMMLEQGGYSLLPAGTPDQAIRVAGEYPGSIDLLLTDVIMPGMSGLELAEKLQELYPRLKRIFMSGYPANVIARHGVLKEGIHFIAKPFSKTELSVKIRDVLDA